MNSFRTSALSKRTCRELKLKKCTHPVALNSFQYTVSCRRGYAMTSRNDLKITLEEHWCSKHARDFYRKNSLLDPHDESGLVGEKVPDLMEFGPRRLAEMDANGISLQVVSHALNTAALDAETCRKINAELFERIGNAPNGRFAGFATLPMAHPEAAARELRLCVRDYQFVGTLIDSNCAGRYYDSEFYWPVFQAAEELDVPIYLHPAANQYLQDNLYTGNFTKPVAESMSSFGFGWHVETAVHFLRLYAAGVFDRFPKLKLVLGHAGEMLPYQLDRTRRAASFWQEQAKLQRSLQEVWNENLWITLSGMFAVAPMECLLRQCKPERIMFGVDYPFGSTKAGVGFLEEMRERGMVSDEVLELITYKNAENLLRLKLRAEVSEV